MSNKARDWARLVSGLTPSETIVLRELAEYYNDQKGEAWPSIDKLHEGCGGINEKTIRRALANLISQGHITRTQRGTRHQPSVYSLNFDRTLTTIETEVQPDIDDLSTGHLRLLNRTSTTFQPDIDVPHIRKEPLRTIKEPLIEPLPVEVQPDIDDLPVSDEFVTRTVVAYEANIALITPAVADQIKAIAEEDNVQPDWGELAIKEAAIQNKRSWGYARGILNRYITQGNTDDRRRHSNNGTGISEDGSISSLDRIARAQGNLT